MMGQKYKRMLSGMQEKEKSSRRRKFEPWYLYILECNDGSFYTGVAKDVARRFKMHESGKASRYTRTHLPVKLIYQEKCKSRTQALVRECAVKTFPKKKKLALVEMGGRSGLKRKRK